MAEQVFIYDCTLRDGTQAENIALGVRDKLHIAEKLDSFGIHYIEGGWPGSNPKDAEFFTKAAKMTWKNAKIAAFGSTRHWKNPVEKDPNIQALLDAETPVVTLVGKSWDFHVTQALKIKLEQNLLLVSESIEYLKNKGREVVFDAEHFFDGYKANPEYAMRVVSAARDAGADWIVLCDTNGGSLPGLISEAAGRVFALGGNVGIHTHNDSELAVANSLAAVEAGAAMVQGTVNGYGERVGNANLTSIIPNLELKMGRHTVGREKLGELTELAFYVSETANVRLPNTLPYAGKSAFAHKGGIHVSAILKDNRTYEHISPELVGNSRRVLVSDLSGKSNLLYKIRELGDFDPEKLDLSPLLKHIKKMEYEGYQFEGAEASFKLLVNHFTKGLVEPFRVNGFRMIVDQANNGDFISEATVKVCVDDEVEHTAAEGNGPVNALSMAVKKALGRFYPEILDIHLVDYKVRVLGSREGTAAKVRVLIESTDGKSSWTTVGVSSNVIEASWIAIVDGLLYKLIFDKE